MSAHPRPPGPSREVIAPPHVSLRKEVGRPAGPPPLDYGEVRLWLVAKGPHELFAYWEFHPEEHPEAVGADGRARFFLRIARGAGGVVEATEEIGPADGKCTVAAKHADANYSAELGFFNNQGVWCFLAQSGAARTPRADAAERRDQGPRNSAEGDAPPARDLSAWSKAQETRLNGLLAEDVARNKPTGRRPRPRDTDRKQRRKKE